nr:hypothetical protein Iba_chr10cCG12060 [Ipomoea batatas]
MAEIMNKKEAVWLHPFGYLLKEISIVLHMLQNLNGKYSVIGRFHIKRGNISNNDVHVLQLKLPTLFFDMCLLGHRVANTCNFAVTIFLCNVEGKRTPATTNIQDSVTILDL